MDHEQMGHDMPMPGHSDHGDMKMCSVSRANEIRWDGLGDYGREKLISR